MTTTLTLVTYLDAARVAHDLALHHGVPFRVEQNSWSEPEAGLWDVLGPEGFVFVPPTWYSEPDPRHFTKWQSLLDGLSTNDNN